MQTFLFSTSYEFYLEYLKESLDGDPNEMEDEWGLVNNLLLTSESADSLIAHGLFDVIAVAIKKLLGRTDTEVPYILLANYLLRDEFLAYFHLVLREYSFGS